MTVVWVRAGHRLNVCSLCIVFISYFSCFTFGFQGGFFGLVVAFLGFCLSFY